MTDKDYIDWSTLLKNTNVTAEHSNASNQIVAATKDLRQTADQFAKVLNEHAKLLANSAQFEAALRDAAAIRVMLPGSGLGYLCAGDVYCQQGRHSAAIAIYDQGLEAVPDSDPYYHQLQQHRTTAVTNNRRVDFISKLPLDIVISNIVPRMNPVSFSESSCELLYVSRTWRERVLKQPNGLHFVFDTEFETFKRGHDQLVQFAPYVQKLEGTIYYANLDDLFSRASFSMLKQVNLSCDEFTPRLPLINGLKLIADSLTHLDIWNCPGLRLRDILESCPRLVSLTLSMVDLIMPSLCYPKMTHLSLQYIQGESLTFDTMVDLLSWFPSLLTLEISPIPDCRFLTVIHKHCPYLQVLYYGFVHGEPYDIDVYPHRRGIALAHLNESHFYMQDDLIQFVHMHQHSLETLHFGDVVKNDNPLWELSNGQALSTANQADMTLCHENEPTLSGTTFNRLVNISFSYYDPPTSGDFIIWLISNAHNLKAITCPESHLQPSVTNAMTKLKHLSKLKIRNSGGDHGFQGIIQFLEYHIAMGNQSTLEEMVILTRKMTSRVTWLPLISRLACLKRLELLGHIPKVCISTMAVIGQGCPALEELSLGMYGAELAQGVMESLSQLSKLKCLRIQGKSLCNSDLLVLTTFPSLQQLHLLFDTKVPDYIEQMLRKHIAKVIIG